ncbi:hypothetical protein PILCRDRAFT_14342 [Piloderma croceum F 1598]|nr:hypothetical protein PILCRDRAFT_14342 [Piloderma croceum F 1598]
MTMPTQKEWMPTEEEWDALILAQISESQQSNDLAQTSYPSHKLDTTIGNAVGQISGTIESEGFDVGVSPMSELLPPSQNYEEAPHSGMAPRAPFTSPPPPKHPSTLAISESSKQSSERPNLGPQAIDYDTVLLDLVYTVYLVAFFQDPFKRFSNIEMDVFVGHGQAQFKVLYPKRGLPKLPTDFRAKLRRRAIHRRSSDVSKAMAAVILIGKGNK